MKKNGKLLPTVLSCCFLLVAVVSSLEGDSFHQLLGTLSRMETGMVDPWLYGAVEEAGEDPYRRLEQWRTAAEEYVKSHDTSLLTLVDQREADFLRRIRAKEHQLKVPAAVPLTEDHYRQLQLLEDHERALLEERIQWEKQAEQEYLEGLLLARREYDQLLQAATQWKEAGSATLKAEQERLLARREDAFSHISGNSLLREEAISSDAASLLSGSAEMVALISRSRLGLLEMYQQAAGTGGKERESWLKEIQELEGFISQGEALLKEYTEAAELLAASPLSLDAEAAHQLLQVSYDFEESIRGYQWSGPGPDSSGVLENAWVLSDLLVSGQERQVRLFDRIRERIAADDTILKEERELELLSAREHELDQALHSLHQGYSLLMAERMHQSFLLEKESYDLSLSTSALLGISQEENAAGAAREALEALLFIQDLSADHQLSSLIFHTALSGYEEGAKGMAPDIGSHNSAFRALLSEIGKSEKSLISPLVAESALELSADPRSAELQARLEGILKQYPEGQLAAAFHEAGVGILNRIVVQEGLGRLETKIDSLSAKVTAYTAQAATYAATAALCYAFLNIPGGVAATAVSVAATTAAIAFNEEKKDLQEIHSMVKATPLNVNPAESRIAEMTETWSSHHHRFRELGTAVEELEIALWLEKPGHAAVSALEKSSGEGKSVEGIYNDAIRLLEEERAEMIKAALILEMEGEERFNRERQDFLELVARSDLNNEENFVILQEIGVQVYRRQNLRRPVWTSNAFLPGEGDAFLEKLESSLSRSLLRAGNRGAATDAATMRYHHQQYLLESALGEAAFHAGNSWWERKEMEHIEKSDDWIRGFSDSAGQYRRQWRERESLFVQERERLIENLYRREAEELAAQVAALPGVGLDRENWMQPLSPLFFSSPADEQEEWAHIPALSFFRDSADAGTEGNSEHVYVQFQERLDHLAGQSSEAAGRFDGMLDSAFRRVLKGSLEDQQEKLYASIAEADRDVRWKIGSAMAKSGYQVSESLYQREVLADLWLGNRERERQEIEAYRNYQAPQLSWLQDLGTMDLRDERLEGFVRQVALESRLFFSAPLEEEKAGSSQLLAQYHDAVQRSGPQAGGGGLFGLHVGEAPEGNRSGSGELGRIFSLHGSHEQVLGRALAMTESAFYDRRFWDDDKDNDGESDTWFRAPAIRSSLDLGVQIAASSLLGPGFGSFLVSMADDLLFAAGDLASGQGDKISIFSGLGKKALLTGIGQFGGAPSGTSGGWSSGSNWVLEAGSSALVTGIKQTAGSAVSALSFSDEGFEFDGKVFMEGAFSLNSLAGIGSSAASSAAGSLYSNAWLTKDASEGMNSFQLAHMGAGGTLLSGAAGSAFSTALTGELTLNLMNAAEIGSLLGVDLSGTGLLELNISGNSMYLSVGSGGMNVSLSMLADASAGFSHLAKRHDLVRFAETAAAGTSLKNALLYQYGFGDDQALLQLERLLSGEDLLALSSDDGIWAESRLHASGREVLLSLENESTPFSSFMVAVMLQHEAYRDGIVDGGNPAETRAAVEAHTELVRRVSSDSLYGTDLLKDHPMLLRGQLLAVDGSLGSLSELAFDSERDFFRITEEGELLFDGSHHLWSAGGTLMAKHDRGSFSLSVADHFGISRDEALSLMEAGGWRWDEKQNSYIDTDPEKRIMVPPEILARMELIDLLAPSIIEGEGISRRAAYAWAVQEHKRRIAAGDTRNLRYELAVREALGSYETFSALTDRGIHSSFSGITGKADLDYYSQQRLESLAHGSDYCLAQSIAFGYVDQFPGVSMTDLDRVFAESDFGNSFNRKTGYVGDKTLFSSTIAAGLGINSVLHEQRFETLPLLVDAIELHSDNYFVIADYDTHFTHVRPDGLEVNSYSGWNKADRDPSGYRLMTWEKE
jgi:hypothetical protein